jgi:NodT family efflux transporter outer membrane factor (OMF) lipoprotein
MTGARRTSCASRSLWRPLVLALPFAGLAACVLAPAPTTGELRDQELTHAPPPPAWKAPGAAPGTVQDNWLATFSDAQLEALVAEAMQYNADLRVAAARAEQAAGYVKAAGGSLFPTVAALGRGGGEMSGDDSGLKGWLVSASWELDLWGRVRYSKRGAEEQYASTEADYVFARESLAALVAKAWFLATEASLQRALLVEAVDATTKLLELAEQRLKVGIGNELDVASAKVTLQTYRDSLRQVEQAQEQSLRALELLLGRYPGAEIAVPAEFRALAADVPAGLPSELLERRPDVIAAEKRVAAAFSRVKEAQAARLPKISITGSVSDLTSDLFLLQDRDNPVWSAGGQVLAPLFTGGSLKAQVEIRTAEQKQAVAQYVQTALNAFGDVENALSSEVALRQRESILTAASADAARALELAQTRYRVGSGDLRAVQQQQVAYLSSRMNLLRVQSEQRVQRVNLHLALGGNFATAA